MPEGRGGDLAPLLSPGEARSGVVSSWAAQDRRDIELLEQVQQRLWKGLKDIPTRKGFGSWGHSASRGDTAKKGPHPLLSTSAEKAQSRDQTLFHGAQQQDKRQPTNLC